MDMHDFTLRVNVHGQRKIANPEVTVLFEGTGVEELMSLGWPEVPGERPIMATVLRDFSKDVDELTRTLTRGAVVTER